MLKGIEFIKTNSSLPRKLGFFEDAGKTEISIGIHDADLLIIKMHEAAKSYISIRHAVVHLIPKNTAFTMLIEQKKIRKITF